MPRATCRCGQVLSVPVNGPDRVICPMCSARVRVRQDESNSGPGDGYMRFNCVCGRRLKVRRGGPTQQAGKCPDCGRIVPVPSTASSQSLRVMAGGSDAMNTQELDDADLAALEDWSQAWRARAQDSEANGDGSEAALASPPDTNVVAPPAMTPITPRPATVRVEAGLRVCPRCGRPIHLGADTCRDCGAHVPRR